MAKPLDVSEVWIERIVEQLSGLEYGNVQITVHDGRIVQIEKTERRRYDLSQLQGQSEAQAQNGKQAPEGGRSELRHKRRTPAESGEV